MRDKFIGANKGSKCPGSITGANLIIKLYMLILDSAVLFCFPESHPSRYIINNVKQKEMKMMAGCTFSNNTFNIYDSLVIH